MNSNPELMRFNPISFGLYSFYPTFADLVAVAILASSFFYNFLLFYSDFLSD